MIKRQDLMKRNQNVLHDDKLLNRNSRWLISGEMNLRIPETKHCL